MHKVGVIACVGFFMASTALADVTVTERQQVKQKAGHQAKAGDRAKADRPAGADKGAGGTSLTDMGGFEYFIDTSMTFTNTYSASGAAMEASYTAAVTATTSLGGTSMTTLTDAFDGYHSICLSATETGPCATGDANYVMYNMNGTPTMECGGRQVVFNSQSILGLDVKRKVYVPDNDEFIRWLDILSNTGGSPVTVNLITSQNLGSDGHTIIVATSSGDTTVDTSDLWATSMQAFSGGSSSDPRLAHVFQGTGAAAGLNAISFVNGHDTPDWSFSVTVPAGGTAVIMTFASGQASRPDAAAKAAQLADPASYPHAVQCMSTAEKQAVVNFAQPVPVSLHSFNVE